MFMENKKLSAELMFVFELIYDALSASWIPENTNDVIFPNVNEQRESVEKLRRYYRAKLNLLTLKECISMLIERGILKGKQPTDEIDPEKFDPRLYELNATFIKSFRRYTYELGKELWDAYPSSGKVDNQEIPLKIIKRHNSDMELFTIYAKMIKYDPAVHKRILSLIKWSCDNRTSFTNMNIETFITSKMWESIEEFKRGNSTGWETLSDEMITYV